MSCRKGISPLYKFFIIFPLLLLSSCGYYLGDRGLTSCYRTICIPYVEGDPLGLMTNALIRSFSSKSHLRYSSYGADLKLVVCLQAPQDKTIGFIYAPGDESDDEAKNIIVSNEARLSILATVSVIDRKTGGCVLSPFIVSSFIDYDYESDLSNIQAHELSLGQLEMHNLAQDAAFLPLFRILAEKIVDYVSYSW